MMLRRFVTIVALVAAVTIAGCGNDPGDTVDVDSDPGSTRSTPATAPTQDGGSYDY